MHGWRSASFVALAAASLALPPASAFADSSAPRSTSSPPPAARTPPRAPAAADDDDDSPNAVLSRCQQRAQGRLNALDHLGDMAHSATERIGRFVGASQESIAHVIRIGHSLSDAIARRLDCREQQQAELATDRAIQGGVGIRATWTSNTRAHVSGSSMVTAQERGGACVTVTDIVIVDGEETRAPKRMCRRPPTNRYVRV